MEQNVDTFNDYFGSLRAQSKYIILIEQSNIYYVLSRRQNYLIYRYNLYTREVVHCGTFTNVPIGDVTFQCRFFSNICHIKVTSANSKINVFMNMSQIPWSNYDMPRMSILWYFNNSPRFILKKLENIHDIIIYNYITHDIQHIQNINQPLILCVNQAETHIAYIDTNYSGYIYEINTNISTSINLNIQINDNKQEIGYMYWDINNVIWIGSDVNIIAYDVNKKISASIRMPDDMIGITNNPMEQLSNIIYTFSDVNIINIYRLNNFQIEKILEIKENLFDGEEDEDEDEDDDDDDDEYSDMTCMWIVGKSIYRYYKTHNMIQYNKISNHSTVKYKLLTTRYKLMNRAKDFDNYFKPFLDNIKKLQPRDRDVLGQHIANHIKTKLDEYNTMHQIQPPSNEYLKKYFDEVKRYYYNLIKKYHPNTIKMFFNPTEEKKYNLVVEEKRKNDNVKMIAAINKMSTSIHSLIYKRNLQFNKYMERKDAKYKEAYEHLHDTLMRRITKYNKRLTELLDTPHPTKPTKKLYTQLHSLIQTTLNEFQKISKQPIEINSSRSSSDSNSISKSSSSGGSRVSPL